jgi:hypothetical protein
MKDIRISASAKQLSRLRNGHKVRVKQAMAGCGFNLVVMPDKYDALTRSFSKGKGSEVQLSLEELQANRAVQGEGIFGKKFDKFLNKVGIKKEVYQLGDVLKEPVKKAIKTLAKGAPAAGATALAGLATAVGQPQLAGVAGLAGKKLGEKAGKFLEKGAIGYIDDPEAYQKNPKKFLGAGVQKLGVRRRASLAQAKKNKEMAKMIEGKGMGRNMGMEGMGMAGCGECSSMTVGNGLYAAGTRGRGLYASSGRGVDMSMTRGIVGTQGGALVGVHPAMKSQPLGSNFHQQYQIPPSFQHLHSGAGLYA